MIILTAFVAFLVPAITSASVVTFDKSPDVIHTILTKHMTLKCSIKDSASAPSGALVGRSILNTQSNVQFVTSIVVLKDGQEVASITPFSPARALQVNGSWDQMNVTGAMQGQAGERGWLTLSWFYPDAAEAGNYTCEVNGINDVGHNLKYTASLSMSVRNPDMNDIIEHVHDQGMELEIQKLKNQEASQKINDLELKLSNLKSNLLTEMENKLDSMRAMLNDSKHYESGEVQFDNSNSYYYDWTSEGNYRTKNITVYFQSPYTKTPIIHLSPVHFDYYLRSSNYDSNYWIDVVDLTETEFTIFCKSIYNSYAYLKDLQVNWISIA